MRAAMVNWVRSAENEMQERKELNYSSKCLKSEKFVSVFVDKSYWKKVLLDYFAQKSFYLPKFQISLYWLNLVGIDSFLQILNWLIVVEFLSEKHR